MNLHYFKVEQIMQRWHLTGEGIFSEISTVYRGESKSFYWSYKLTSTQGCAFEKGSRAMFRQNYFERGCCTIPALVKDKRSQITYIRLARCKLNNVRGTVPWRLL